MRLVKKMLLLATIGTMTVVLAGCYGASFYRDRSNAPEPPDRDQGNRDQGIDRPVPGLRTARSPDSARSYRDPNAPYRFPIPTHDTASRINDIHPER